MASQIPSSSVRMAVSSRRAWLGSTTAVLTGLMNRRLRLRRRAGVVDPALAARLAAQATPQDPTPWEALAHQGVDAARAAGAQYADVRLTRTCGQRYAFGASIDLAQGFADVTGVGVRALVNGTWGFAACPWPTADAVAGTARDAIAQAKVNARRSQPVEWASAPVVQGTWTTPVKIDPFTIPIEEKRDYIAYIQAYGNALGISSMMFSGALEVHRQERILATSEGTLVTQTCFETGAGWQVDLYNLPLGRQGPSPELTITGLEAAGLGWEHILDADIPGQLQQARDRLQEEQQLQKQVKPVSVGRYTLVCDGATMAALLERTLGIATQLDRALGYEANAAGTSFLDDPLGMVGHFSVAASLITVTANRTAPGDLATVKWDDEGVAAESFTLVNDGVLVDFQTTRAQAGWLAPYYTKAGRPVTSHGCAAAEDALGITLAMQPNLVLAPGASTVRLDDLVANVPQGILVTEGNVTDLDSQARTGVLEGQMREIRNGRVGSPLAGGAVLFDTLDLWKHVVAVGGASTEGRVVSPSPRFRWIGNGAFIEGRRGMGEDAKGQPPQSTSRTTRGVAAMILNQPIINLARKV